MSCYDTYWCIHEDCLLSQVSFMALQFILIEIHTLLDRIILLFLFYLFLIKKKYLSLTLCRSQLQYILFCIHIFSGLV